MSADHQLPEPQLAAFELCRLLFEIDRAKRGVRHTDTLEIHGRTDVCLHFAAGALAGKGHSAAGHREQPNRGYRLRERLERRSCVGH
jgi:hypothetical protein